MYFMKIEGLSKAKPAVKNVNFSYEEKVFISFKLKTWLFESVKHSENRLKQESWVVCFGKIQKVRCRWYPCPNFKGLQKWNFRQKRFSQDLGEIHLEI